MGSSQDFTQFIQVLDEYVRTRIILTSNFLSCIWNETVLATNFIPSISESTRCYLYLSFNNKRFNCSRWLLSFIMLKKFSKPCNLSICLYAIDHINTWHDMIDCEGTSGYQLVYGINLFLTYGQLLLHWDLKS